MIECKWFSIENKLVVLVSKENSKTVIRYSNTVYHNGDLQKYYKELYYNNPCKFYKKYVDHKVIYTDTNYKDIDGNYIIELYKEGKFNF